MAQRLPIRPKASGAHLWLLLAKAGKAVAAQARRSIETTGLCLSDFGVLETLLHKGPQPVSALGKKVLLSSGSITSAVDRLERGGLVVRAALFTDRRARIVHLTRRGSTLIRKLFAEHERDLERVFSSLATPERHALAQLLRKLGHNAAGDHAPIKNQQARR